jgi:hypothetical protein
MGLARTRRGGSTSRGPLTLTTPRKQGEGRRRESQPGTERDAATCTRAVLSRTGGLPRSRHMWSSWSAAAALWWSLLVVVVVDDVAGRVTPGGLGGGVFPLWPWSNTAALATAPRASSARVTRSHQRRGRCLTTSPFGDWSGGAPSPTPAVRKAAALPTRPEAPSA